MISNPITPSADREYHQFIYLIIFDLCKYCFYPISGIPAITIEAQQDLPIGLSVKMLQIVSLECYRLVMVSCE